MKRTMLAGKVHRATVTDADVDYEGSLTLDPDLMEAAGMLAYEQVHLLDIDNGARLVTYLITGERASGQVCVNGAAARLVHPGDKVIIVAYAEMDDDEAKAYQPKVVLVDGDNRPVTAEHHERAAPPRMGAAFAAPGSRPAIT
ncbi:MAG: aspartate 1-decarboxylase [Actinomycetota bacterium]